MFGRVWCVCWGMGGVCIGACVGACVGFGACVLRRVSWGMGGVLVLWEKECIVRSAL